MVFTVLLAVDGSGHANRAFDFYFTHLHQPDNKVVVAYAAEQLKLSAVDLSQPLALPVEKWQEEMSKRVAEANKIENEYTTRLASLKGLSYKVRTLYSGAPGESIVTIAGEEGVDHIVLGSRGLGAVRRTFLGSVSDYVLHHAHVPVTICPPPAGN